MEGESFSTPFAGLLFITLAAEGRLVLDAGRADELIAGLERTHSSVRTRLTILRQRQAGPAERVVELPDDASRDIVDAVFADQIAPGLLERANEEIPRYIEALRVARRPPLPGCRAGFKNS
jgi:hypothetical protein